MWVCVGFSICRRNTCRDRPCQVSTRASACGVFPSECRSLAAVQSYDAYCCLLSAIGDPYLCTGPSRWSGVCSSSSRLFECIDLSWFSRDRCCSSASQFVRCLGVCGDLLAGHFHLIQTLLLPPLRSPPRLPHRCLRRPLRNPLPLVAVVFVSGVAKSLLLIRLHLKPPLRHRLPQILTLDGAVSSVHLNLFVRNRVGSYLARSSVASEVCWRRPIFCSRRTARGFLRHS